LNLTSIWLNVLDITKSNTVNIGSISTHVFVEINVIVVQTFAFKLVFVCIIKPKKIMDKHSYIYLHLVRYRNSE